MKNHSKFALAVFLLVAAAPFANAGILELRGGAGILSNNSHDFEDDVHAIDNNGISTNDFQTYNADLFVNLPALPIGFGVRQEWLNVSDDSNGDSLDLKTRNTSLLVDLRIIDTAFYIGPILAIGYPTADLDFHNGTGGFKQSLKGKRPSYSGGLEAGVILGNFLVGAEAGYQSIELQHKDNPSGVDANVDLNGFYGKALVGLTFL
jgi:hypothetical protein